MKEDYDTFPYFYATPHCNCGRILKQHKTPWDLNLQKESELKVRVEGRCDGCPFREKCTASRARTLQVSWEMERFKKVARENLSSEKGIELRKRRGNEVESVFGDSKLNKNHRRYILRGLKNVSLEAGLHYIAHNIKKIKRFFDKKPNKDIYSYFFIPKKWTFWTSPTCES